MAARDRFKLNSLESRCGHKFEIAICMFESDGWEPCHLIGVSDLEDFFCSILNKHNEELEKHDMNDLISESINSLFARE